MSARKEVTKDVASQVIHFYPREGRPSSTPSVEIKDQYGNTITTGATTYVTQGTANTTVATANSVGDTSIVLTSVSGIDLSISEIRDTKTYLLTNSLLQKEWVTVIGVDSTNKIAYLDEQLEYVHDTAATFVDTSFYYTLQTAEVDELVEMYRARASYTVDSVVYTQEINFDVVLTPLVNPLTVSYIKDRYPDLMLSEHDQTRGSDYLSLRRVAWDRVLSGIRSHGWRPGLIKTPEGLEDWALAEFELAGHKAGVDILAGEWEAEQAMRYLIEEAASKKMLALNRCEFYDKDDNDSPSDNEIFFIEPNFRR